MPLGVQGYSLTLGNLDTPSLQGKEFYYCFRMYRWLRFLRRVQGMRCVAAVTASGVLFQAASTRREAKSTPMKEDFVVNTRSFIRPDRKLSKRELRFLDFASVEYDDIIYMTPNDFLDSLVLDMPRGKLSELGVYPGFGKEKWEAGDQNDIFSNFFFRISQYFNDHKYQNRREILRIMFLKLKEYFCFINNIKVANIFQRFVTRLFQYEI